MPKTLDKSGSLYTLSSNRDKQGKWCYLKVKSSYLHISTTKDADPYMSEVRTSIKGAFQCDNADPCKIKIEFNKRKPIFLKASSKEETKKWIDVLMWKHDGPPTEMQPTVDPPPYDESIQPRVQIQHRDKLDFLSKVCSII